MKEVILIKNGELALKGLNRRTFEEILIKNARRRLASTGKYSFERSQSTITVFPEEGADLDEAEKRIGKTFGIAGYSRAAAVEKDMETILKAAGEYLAPRLLEARTFKAEAKRSDKNFPLDSPRISAVVGEYILKKFPNLSVDVKSPDVTVNVEIRDAYAYIRADQLKGAGGMPGGVSGKAVLLLSGGIDSPVAGYMAAKRGLELVAVHFAAPPYTSERAEKKVRALTEKVSEYAGRISLFIIPFTKIQESVKDLCPEDITTVISRRMMMRTARIIAEKENAKAFVTGESLAQVASQTTPAIACVDAVCDLPVFRPLIGMDKNETIALSRKIETFDISILPYEDCCSVFTPKHPRTRPTLEYVENCEKPLALASLANEAANGARRVIINAY